MIYGIGSGAWMCAEIVLIGKKFWKDCIQWDAFVHYGMISDWDAQQLRFADTAEEPRS